MKKLFLSLLLIVFCLLPHTALGAWGNSVYPKEQEIQNDLIKADDKVILEGTVKGDVLIGGSTVRNSGHVINDFLALGYYVHHQGRIEGNARAVGKDIIIDGVVEKNLSALGYRQTFGVDSIVKGNLTAFGSNITLSGKVEGKVIVRADSVTIGGEIGKDVEVYANSLTILPRAKFNGSITYFGPKKADINSVAKFSTPLVFKPVPVQSTGSKIAFRLASLLLLAALAALLLPKSLLTTAQKLILAPGRSMMFGSIFFVIIPLFSLLLAWFNSLRLTALVLTLTWGSIGLITFFLAQVIWGTVVGKLLWTYLSSTIKVLNVGPNLAVFLQTIIGTILVCLVSQIPYLGTLFSICLMLYCTGYILSKMFTEARWKTQLSLEQRAKSI